MQHEHLALAIGELVQRRGRRRRIRAAWRTPRSAAASPTARAARRRPRRRGPPRPAPPAAGPSTGTRSRPRAAPRYTYSSRSNVVRISTRAGGSPAVEPPRRLDAVHRRHPHVHHARRRAAAVANCRIASSPSIASPTTSMSSSASRIMRNPPRIAPGRRRSARGWSRLRAAVDRRSGCRARTTNPPPGRAPVSIVAAQERDALAHPDQSAAAPSAPAAAPTPSSVTSTRSRSCRVAQQHARVGAVPAVLQRVRERLLHDAIAGEVDADRQRRGVAFGDELDGESGRPHPIQEFVEQRRAPAAGPGSASARPRRPGAAASLPGRADPTPRSRGALARPRRDRAGAPCARQPAWTTITLMLWATMSWSSRAIRSRSNVAASRAACSRSRWIVRCRFHTTRPKATGTPTVKNALLAISTQLAVGSDCDTTTAAIAARTTSV